MSQPIHQSFYQNVNPSANQRLNQFAWHQMSGNDGANRDRWLLSYADLLTLLLAFFVVMYSVSAINETKLSELSKSLSASFNQTPGQAADAFDLKSSVSEQSASKLSASKGSGVGIIEPDKLIAALGIGSDFKIDEGNPRSVTISIPGELLFGSAESSLKPGARSELDKLLPILASASGEIEVIGHTDNLPLSTARYPSNWELSAHRAAAAVRYLEQAGIARSRLLAIGRADVEPVASNDFEQGRASNRRVVFKASQVDWSLLEATQRKTEMPIDAQQQPTLESPLDIDAIDPALLEQVLRDLDSGEH